MEKTFNFGDFTVRTSKCGKYANYGSHWVPIRQRGRDRYIVRVKDDKKCPKGNNLEKLFLYRE